MLGKKNQGNGYWNLSSTRGLVSKFFGDGSSEIEKFFNRRVTYISRSKHHTGRGYPGLIGPMVREIEVMGEIGIDSEVR